MQVCIGVPKEQMLQEQRIALTPEIAEKLAKLGAKIVIETNMGKTAYCEDTAFKAAQIVASAEELYQQADVILKVQPPLETEIELMKKGTVVIGFMSPHRYQNRLIKLRDKRITCLAMEFVPHIVRAQSMNALSSQATVTGYKAVIRAADLSSVFFPQLTAATGTIRPAKVLVIGAGITGLQAIATSRRLGAIVTGCDIQNTKEQVESLGAKFVDIEIKDGHTQELTDEENQQAILAEHVATANVVITTVTIPGCPSPKIITREMVASMTPGSVIVDTATEGGGNCELTKVGKTIEYQNVVVHSPISLPWEMSVHASEMYAKNLFNLLSLMLKDGELQIDWDDEVIAACTLTHAGKIKHALTRELVEGV